jgi:hypothetical protein
VCLLPVVEEIDAVRLLYGRIASEVSKARAQFVSISAGHKPLHILESLQTYDLCGECLWQAHISIISRL